MRLAIILTILVLSGCERHKERQVETIRDVIDCESLRGTEDYAKYCVMTAL